MDDYTVKSVEKACLLLEVLGSHPEGLAVTDLAARVGMYKSTVHRLLTTLMKRGFIEQVRDTGHYKLGYTVVDLGMRLLDSIDLRKESRPYLQELAATSNEVVHLALLERGEVVYVEKVESDNSTRMHSRVGQRVPVHGTGLGKAILAFLPTEAAEEIMQKYGLPKLTPATITDLEEFRQVLGQTRELGYAFDVEEHEPGVCCVAAPIIDYTGKVVASCSVSGPTTRMTGQRLRELAPQVRTAAVRISARLGGVGPHPELSPVS
ncbi:IclR family transcriptional regulator [Alicyclobacillaceae bacterium I2511]|nr:IclR family transcriptional regulator [Alicyclobacillaceae bacterium I2511]